MITKKAKLELELEALNFAKQRRMDFVQEQETELIERTNKPPVFLRVTRRITDGEKRLINFITKTLAADVFLESGLADAIIL